MLNNMETREQLIQLIKREFIGPDNVKRKEFLQDNGEEILIGDPPRIRYSAGILYPQNKKTELNQDIEALENDTNVFEREINEIIKPNIVNEVDDFLGVSDEILNLSNSYNQSSLSLTVNVRFHDNIIFQVNAGIYESKTEKDSKNKDIQKHYRSSIKTENIFSFSELPSKQNRIKKIKIYLDDKNTDLELYIIHRYEINDSMILTFSLVNSKNTFGGSIRTEDCFFQTEFSIISSKGFNELPKDKKIKINDDDFQSNRLLYRNVSNYANGHGCSGEWEFNNGFVYLIRTTIFPTYDIKPIIPSTLKDVTLNMFNLSKHENFKENIISLNKLCEQYNIWIEDLESKLSELSSEDILTAKKHIDECKKCNLRIKNGIDLLKNDLNVRLSFEYMNEAMLSQQLHYRLPLRKWKENKSNDEIEIEYDIVMPRVNDEESWFDAENNVYGIWRPFQLAFILMNLNSINSVESQEREIVDLIWFPTGGGKTEAYLGLSAFTIFLRKIKDKNAFGSSVLMRYTLRLLTAQQYERASSLICACELIRKMNPQLLGEERITIGLWVGNETTPNKMNSGENSAVKAFQDMYKGQRNENPFIMLKCPWCGAQMGIVDLKNNYRKLPGYSISKKKNGKQVFSFKCFNKECDFSTDENDLPLTVIDEEIYENPTTLLIGTVDKFAMLPYLPVAQRIFGIKDGERLNSPDLIIQDELHLISGPLGSTVGLYETMINELSTYNKDGIIIKPKIIASTATISKAKEQCNALFNCGLSKVLQFPPAGLDAGESFFAKEDKNGVGRKYVGIYATSTSSYSMTIIRLYAALLYASNALDVKNKIEKDPYWTNLGYFNSLRELGQTATWISADIDEYLHTIYKRRYEDQENDYKLNRRYIWRYEELTSRIAGDKVTQSLQNLNIKYTDSIEHNRPVDICLATNMISVGVDIQRLGLMTVIGQPKTTSEYIQATSRVGRSSTSPGVVFTVYNPGRPRDRSHYEQFNYYHSKIYAYVEPSSVTPFSSPLRDRALHAIVIGLIRLNQKENNYNNPNIFNQSDLIQKVKDVLKERISNIDPEELENSMQDVEEILDLWEARRPSIYHDFNNGSIEPLMYMSGIAPNKEWDDRGFKTPTSMRSVDKTCEVKVIDRRYTSDEELD